jgi:small subunit ribosomal protein S14
MKGKLLNDRLRRLMAYQNEIYRNSLRFVTHTDILPLSVRMVAQFKLDELPKATNLHHLTRRCILHGRGRNIIPEFNISRIVFRNMAMQGRLPGIRKSSW